MVPSFVIGAKSALSSDALDLLNSGDPTFNGKLVTNYNSRSRYSLVVDKDHVILGDNKGDFKAGVNRKERCRHILVIVTKGVYFRKDSAVYL
jgi:cell shape-determining protein MreC